jgi:error-prone DNA polymerase
MERKGIAKQFAERVFDQIRGFGEYGFPESHAASFALIAYCTAWMRSRYPEVFACALLNAWPMGFYAPATIVADARRHGIRILPVDAQKSRWECTLEAVDGARGNGGASNAARGASRRRLAIRMGLRFVKGFGKQHWKRISTLARDEMESVKEFARASGLDHGALGALARSGALECFGLDRRQSLWTVLGRQGRVSRSSEAAAGSRTGDGAVYAFVDETPAAAGEGGTAGEAAVGDGEPAGEVAAAGEEELGLEDETESASFPELDAYQTVVWDYQHAMHSAGSHPLEPHREALTQAGYPDAAGVHAFKHGRRISYIGLVICRQRPDTAKGTVFFTLEDETGFVNLIVRQEVFQKHRAVLLTSAFLGIHGTVQTDGGTVQIIVDSCFRPRLSGTAYRQQSRDFH